MSWVRLDDEFTSHPKVAQLTDREFRVHVRVLCYCAKFNTRGEVVKGAFNDVPGLTRKLSEKFVATGLWDKPVDKTANPHVHDFQVYNPKDPGAALRKQRQRDRDRDTSRDNHRDQTRDRNVTPHAPAGAPAPAIAADAPGSPSPEELVRGEGVVKGRTALNQERARNATALPEDKQREVLNLLHAIGDDADNGQNGKPSTIAVLNNLAHELPVGSLAKVRESLEHRRPRPTNRAAYAVGSLQAERDAINSGIA